MRYIRLNESNVVVSVRVGSEIVDGEIQSEIGECGDVIQDDGTFAAPDPATVSPPPTLAEIKDNQLILMDAVATLYEMMIGGV